MSLAAKRVFRLSLTITLALGVAYALAQPLPFVAPLFAFMLGAAPKPPMGLKGLLGLLLVLVITMSSGLLVLPALLHYPATGLLLVLLGLYFANYVTLNLGKAPVGALLTMGVAMISAAGLAGYAVATSIIEALCINMAIAVVCQWLVYPLFPEEQALPPAAPPAEPLQSSWLALRCTLIVYPVYLLVLTNPIAYMAIIMKSVALGQQASETDVRVAGRELVGSTVFAALLAILMWVVLKQAPELWIYMLLTLLVSLYVVAKFYGVLASRYTPTFWQNVLLTTLILIGPAVGDTESGKDPYKGSAVRISLFLCVAMYAWGMQAFLEHLRARLERKYRKATEMEARL